MYNYSKPGSRNPNEVIMSSQPIVKYEPLKATRIPNSSSRKRKASQEKRFSLVKNKYAAYKNVTSKLEKNNILNQSGNI